MGRKVSLCKWQMFWMATCLICSFIFILFYIERKWLLMRNLVTIFLFKSKLSVNLQRFDAIDGSIENFQLKLKIVKQAQSFIRKIYRKLQAFTFKVIQECSSWESRKGAVQLFFLTPKKKKKNACQKIFKVRQVLAVLREHVILNVEWVEICKMIEFFWAKIL